MLVEGPVGGQYVTASRAVQVTRAALCEAGHPDLAEHVRQTGDGMPWWSVSGWRINTREQFDAFCRSRFGDVTVRAFVLGHQAIGHHAWVGESKGVPLLGCVDCGYPI